MASAESSSKIKAKPSLINMLQGMAIGAANVVPGVSGGTLALIFGIYETLIDSLKSFARKPFLQAVFSFKIGLAFTRVNGAFLLPLFLGVFIAIFSLARGLEWLFVNQPILILSFFFGLILASIVPVSRYIKTWDSSVFISFFIGTLIGFLLVGLSPTSIPNSWFWIMISGALAATAFILPGISGAFILVLLGNYEFILAAANQGNLRVISLLIAGAIFGIISLAQLLSWLFKHYHDLTLSVLAGFMLGSLRKIWPWKTGGFEDTDVVSNVLPQLFINGQLNLELLWAGGLVALGISIVLLIDRLGKTPHS